MNKRISLGIALGIMLIVAAVTFSMTYIYSMNKFNSSVNDLREREQMYEKIAEIDRLVRQNYYGGINNAQLMDSAAKGYLGGIGDPYSMYITADEYKKLTESEEEHVGIGAVIEQAPDDFYLLVTEVYAESPAQVAGIEVGDLIVKIDDTDLTRENSRQMQESIVGPQGTRITVVVRRGAEELPLMEMTRRAISIPTVEARMMEQAAPEEPLIGYIRIMEFGDRTYDQFNRELQRLTDAGAQAMVFDVRDNKGGVLRSATRILDKLLPDGVLVNATYKDGTTEAIYTSDANQVYLPMAVIVNGNTASSAELFAQSIRDYDKGRIIGVSTVGKGVMQNLIRLSDGSAIDLTVALLRTKSGIDINGVGVKPDYEVRQEGDWTVLSDTFDAQRARAKEVVIGMLRSAEVSEEAASQEEGAEGEESETEPATEGESTEGVTSGTEPVSQEESAGDEEATEAETEEQTQEETVAEAEEE